MTMNSEHNGHYSEHCQPDSEHNGLRLSVALSLRLAQFVARLFGGQLNNPEAVAAALDELSDLAWAEAEKMSPPV